MPDWWSRVSESVEQALAAPPDDRRRLLEAMAATDRALHDEVVSLLSAWEEEGGRFEEPAAVRLAIAPTRAALAPGDPVGPYRVVREVGRGGMGSVYEAYRADDDFRKRVAIKAVAYGRGSAGLARRFRRERRILARLEHRNIAALLDGGVLADGSPYFAMEYVEGQPIDEYCQARALPVRERLQLMRQVCGAVHFAHQNLVVHRDLKPGNILVTADGTVKLLDFGIAKLVAGDDESSGEQDLTGLGGGPFTLAYASPEQVRGEAVTTASDVHALGAVLFKVLTGRHPFRDVDLASAELRRRILEVPPPASGLGADLDAIIGSAMHKDPGRRYPSVQQLGEDLRRYLEGQPVAARPDSVGYRVAKFVRRNRASVGASALALVALVGAVLVSARQARVAATERDRARVEAAKANRVTAFVQDMLRSADPRQAGRDVTVTEALAAASRRADSTLAGEPTILAAVKTAIGLSYHGLGRYADAEPLLRHALEIRRSLGAEPTAELAASLRNLAMLHNDRGELAPAESLFAQSLAAYRAAMPPDSAGLALALNDRADLLQYRGDLAGAEAAHREALAIRERLDGPRSESVAASVNNLAVVLGQQGHWVVAESLHLQSAAIVREVRGPEHPDVASGLTSAAFAVQAQGRLAEAESLYRAALTIREKVLGRDHPETARTHMNLGWLLHDLGRYGEALDEAAIVLAQRKAFGDGHPAIGSTLMMRGQSLMRLGRVRESEAVFRDAMAIRELALPAGHWLIAATGSALGEALLLQGRYAPAESLLLPALAVLRKERGEDQELTRLARSRLVTLYERWGRPAEASKYR